jgi:hypothetical protein
MKDEFTFVESAEIRRNTSTKRLFAYTERAKYSEETPRCGSRKPLPEITITPVLHQKHVIEKKRREKHEKELTSERKIVLNYRLQKKKEKEMAYKELTPLNGPSRWFYRNLSRRRIDVSSNEIIERLKGRGIDQSPSPPWTTKIPPNGKNYVLDSSHYSSFGSERYLATPKRKLLKQYHSDINNLTKKISCFSVGNSKDELDSGKHSRKIHVYLCCCKDDVTFKLPSVE